MRPLTLQRVPHLPQLNYIPHMAKPPKFTPYTWLEQKRLLEEGKSSDGIWTAILFFVCLAFLIAVPVAFVYSLISPFFR